MRLILFLYPSYRAYLQPYLCKMFCMQKIIASGKEFFSIRNLSVRNTVGRNSQAIGEIELCSLDSSNLDVFEGYRKDSWREVWESGVGMSFRSKGNIGVIQTKCVSQTPLPGTDYCTSYQFAHLEKAGNGWNVYHRSCLESFLVCLFCLLESGQS